MERIETRRAFAGVREPGAADYIASDDNDFGEHVRSYAFFLRVLGVGVCHILSCLLVIAIGGVLGHWYIAFFWLVVATGAAAAGVMVPAWGAKPGAVVLVLTLATFALCA